MAILVFTNASIVVNGVDLSDHVRSVTLDYTSDILDGTTFTNAVTRYKVGGFLDWSFTVEFLQDYAASKVDATLYPLMGTQFVIKVRPVNAVISVSNPEYQGIGFLEDYPIFGGGVGEMSTATCTIRANSVLSRYLGTLTVANLSHVQTAGSVVLT